MSKQLKNYKHQQKESTNLFLLLIVPLAILPCKFNLVLGVEVTLGTALLGGGHKTEVGKTCLDT